MSIARGRSAPPSSQQEQHMEMCSLPMCWELWRGVHKCARLCFGVHSLCTCVGFGCARCARCAECRWPWRRFSASVLRSVRTFAECVGLCRRTRRASESVWRLGRVVRGSGKTAPERISAWGAKASPGAESGSFSVRREKWRLFRGRPGPSGGGFGDLAKSGAPAAILINAYSGDFCHPVLSNALAQEPLVYHSGTRELFSDIFGNTSKTDGTESDIFGNFDFFEILSFFSNLSKSVHMLWKMILHVRACSQKHFDESANCSKTFLHVRNFLQMCKCANVQMCKCAKNRRAQNAQICSANIFPNAEITNLHCAQKHKCKFLHMSQFSLCTISTNKTFCVVFEKIFLYVK